MDERLSNDDVVFSLYQWERPSWSIAQRPDFVVSVNTPLSEIAVLLANCIGLADAANLRVAKFTSYVTVKLCELADTEKTTWMSIATDKRSLKDLARSISDLESKQKSKKHKTCTKTKSIENEIEIINYLSYFF